MCVVAKRKSRPSLDSKRMEQCLPDAIIGAADVVAFRLVLCVSGISDFLGEVFYQSDFGLIDQCFVGCVLCRRDGFELGGMGCLPVFVALVYRCFYRGQHCCLLLLVLFPTVCCQGDYPCRKVISAEICCLFGGSDLDCVHLRSKVCVVIRNRWR